MNQIIKANNSEQKGYSYMDNNIQIAEQKSFANNPKQNHVSDVYQPSGNQVNNNNFQIPNNNFQVPNSNTNKNFQVPNSNTNNNFQIPNNNKNSSTFNNNTNNPKELTAYQKVFKTENGVTQANYDDIVKYNNSLQIKEIQPKCGKISRIIETTAPNP